MTTSMLTSEVSVFVLFSCSQQSKGKLPQTHSSLCSFSKLLGQSQTAAVTKTRTGFRNGVTRCWLYPCSSKYNYSVWITTNNYLNNTKTYFYVCPECYKKTGSTFWPETTSKALKSEDGSAQAVIAVAVITSLHLVSASRNHLKRRHEGQI